MCPATGSIGSFSPRKRDPFRTSSKRISSFFKASLICSASKIHGFGVSAWNSPESEVSWPDDNSRFSCIHCCQPPSSRAAFSCPSHCSIHQSLPEIAPPLSSYATTCMPALMPKEEKVWAQVSGSGSGCRPCCPFPTGAERSRSRCAKRAPGMWASW